MAQIVLKDGDMLTEMKKIAQANFDDIVALDAAGLNQIDETLLVPVTPHGLIQFLQACVANVAVIDTALTTTANSEKLKGKSLYEARESLNTMFTAMYAGIV